MQQTELKIDGMMCEACVAHVTKALNGVPGVVQAKVELNPGRATVEHEGADEQALVATVREQDYEAEVVSDS